jgi:hypothetical protein
MLLLEKEEQKEEQKKNKPSKPGEHKLWRKIFTTTT